MKSQLDAVALPAVFESKVKLAAFIEELRHGGSYFPLFLRRQQESQDFRTLIWGNAWLVSARVKIRLEKSERRFQSADYFQRGFHPALWKSGGPKPTYGYEPIYGGEEEPLVLGWSVDKKTIDASLSQEFERFYKLTMTSGAHTTRWDSLEEGFDNVVMRELYDKEGFVVAHLDFLRDYQDVRRMWVLLSYFGEWIRLPIEWHGDKRVLQKEVREKNAKRESYFGSLDEKGDNFTHLRMWGYVLLAPPTKPQFSKKWATPRSLVELTKGIQLHTSNGKAKPAEAKVNRSQSKFFMSIVVFDQEVLSKYQQQPAAEASIGHLSSLTLRTRDLHILHDFYLLGTEYLWTFMDNFVTAIPLKEWAHWQSYNVPHIGHEKVNALSKQDTLFDFVKTLTFLGSQINELGSRFDLQAEPLFALGNLSMKDRAVLTCALPRKTSPGEFLRRVQALNSFVLETLSTHRLRTFLRGIGYDSPELDKLYSLKLLTTFAAVAAVMSRAMQWTTTFQEARDYAVARMLEWNVHSENRPREYLEDYKIIEATFEKLEPIFGIHDLRQLSAHNVSSEVEDQIESVLETHLKTRLNREDYRGHTLQMYRALIESLRSILELDDYAI
jgi:hypothetical protein